MASAIVVQGPSSSSIIRGPDGRILAGIPTAPLGAGAIPGIQGFSSPPPFISAQVATPFVGGAPFIGGAGAPFIGGAGVPFIYGAGAPIIGGASSLLLAPQGSGLGLEGQYIPDNTERLYDDGSFKPWVYGY